LLARISEGEHTGCGEAAGVYYLKDDAPHMLAEAERVRAAIEAGASRDDLQTMLPPGGARNALDCALWALEAQQTGTPVWQLAGIDPPRPLLSTLTLGADAPEAMAAAAQAIDPLAPVKVKLTGELALDTARIAAIRAARPGAWIGVDANQGYDRATLEQLLPVLLAHDIAQLEQPLKRGDEASLDGLARPLPFVADESALCLADTEALVGRFDLVNIKLDKCGGLTEALAIARRARELGLGVMVGNMMGTSLAMAPSFIVGQYCDVVDLDGPTFLARDRTPSVTYARGHIDCAPSVWEFAE
ncbi:MAG: hypothetical protein RIS17_84, partial [Pseudomonadota bacterium]